jgi:hypothetical protein
MPPTHPNSFEFNGSMSRPVLESYLSHTQTMENLLQGHGYFEDNLRMLANTGARFAGRAMLHWGREDRLLASLVKGQDYAQRIHAAVPQIILQGGIFEIVTRQVETIAIPEWVFTVFDQPVEKRPFRYAGMTFKDGTYVDHWALGSSVPDITRLETQMWIFFMAGSYINIGIEAIHFGQIMLIGRHDPDLTHWWKLLSQVRAYAAQYARRRFVLCDAHVSSGVGCYGLPEDASLAPGGFRTGDRLLLDFHALPLRIKEVTGQPWHAELAVGHLDALYGRSLGGITPSGWSCDHLPYLVEFDNWGSSGHGGESVGGWLGPLTGISDRYWVWGWDEICWFAHQSEEDCNAWLRYAQSWVQEHDSNGFLQMPGMRGLADPVGSLRAYYANTRSPTCPEGFGQEETIKAIWRNNE